MRYFYLSFLFCCIQLTAIAQEIKVLNGSNNMPLSYAKLSVEGEEKSYFTGEDGIVIVPKNWKKKEIEVRSSGFIIQKITPNQWNKNRITISLSEVYGYDILRRIEIVGTRLRAPLTSLPSDIIHLNNPSSLKPTNMSDALERSGEVFVQKSQLGGGSPVIRGMEANRLLLVVDGVRMNTAIFRAGHLQNLLRLDPNGASHVEILSGSGSTIYGSDALGGVISVNTAAAQRALGTENSEFHSGITLRNSSGNLQYFDQENAMNFWFNAGFRKWATRTSISFSQFGDLRQGAEAVKSEWLNTTYSQSVSGQDVAIHNANPLIQKRSGYSQLDVQQRAVFLSKNDTQHQLNLQLSTSSNVNRFDRLSELSNPTTPAYSEWYYGPETRILASYQLDFYKKRKWFDSGRLIAAYQYNKESRVSRRFGKSSRTSRFEAVNSYSINGDWAKELPCAKLYFGFEGYYNDVTSSASALNVLTGEEAAASTRYPAGGTNVWNGAVYVNAQKTLARKIIVTAGARYTVNNLEASFGTQEFYPFPFKTAQQRNNVLCGQAGFVYTPIRKLNIRAQYSQGFRSANVDDLAKVFDSSPGSLIIPNPDLLPERTETVDGSITWNQGGRFTIQVGAFYTLLHDAITTEKSNLQGADSVLYDGVLSEVRSASNIQKAAIYGVHARVGLQLLANLKLNATAHYTYGSILSDTASSPLDHIPPFYGRISLDRTISKKWGASAWMIFNAEKPLSLYNVNGEDNLIYATPNGMPAWHTLNLSAQFNPKDYLQLSLSCENILDMNYRVFASGISSSGRLIRIQLKYNF
jgi:hemoglobin/transferrin/lactoferrin receptor protein